MGWKENGPYEILLQYTLMQHLNYYGLYIIVCGLDRRGGLRVPQIPANGIHGDPTVVVAMTILIIKSKRITHKGIS